MAGAIAGTAILRAPERSDRIHTVALTINNRCNLDCPHCYLQYNGRAGLAGKDAVEAVLSSSFQHLAIVGKEPFVDDASLALVDYLANRAREGGRTVSVISNGLSLARVPGETLAKLAYIDVSLDGGPKTYGSYRGGSLRKLVAGLEHAARFVELNALHVLSSATLPFVGDMAAAHDLAPFRRMMFSPYLVTANHGLNSVQPVQLAQVLRALSSSRRFLTAQSTFLLLDGLHLEAAGHSETAILRQVERFGLQRKILVFSRDPLEKGFLRVNYDGLVLAPLDSLDPARYANCAVHVSQDPLDAIFGRLQGKTAA